MLVGAKRCPTELLVLSVVACSLRLAEWSLRSSDRPAAQSAVQPARRLPLEGIQTSNVGAEEGNLLHHETIDTRLRSKKYTSKKPREAQSCGFRYLTKEHLVDKSAAVQLGKEDEVSDSQSTYFHCSSISLRLFCVHVQSK